MESQLRKLPNLSQGLCPVLKWRRPFALRCTSRLKRMPTSGSFKSQIQIWKNKATSLGQNALVFVLMDYLINYIWVNNLSSAFMFSGQVSWTGWCQPHAGCVPIMYGLLICHTGSSVISGSLEAHAMVPAQACQYLCPWLGVMCHAPAYLVEPCATQPSFWTSCCSSCNWWPGNWGLAWNTIGAT